MLPSILARAWLASMRLRDIELRLRRGESWIILGLLLRSPIDGLNTPDPPVSSHFIRSLTLFSGTFSSLARVLTASTKVSLLLHCSTYCLRLSTLVSSSRHSLQTSSLRLFSSSMLSVSTMRWSYQGCLLNSSNMSKSLLPSILSSISSEMSSDSFSCDSLRLSSILLSFIEWKFMFELLNSKLLSLLQLQLFCSRRVRWPIFECPALACSLSSLGSPLDTRQAFLPSSCRLVGARAETSTLGGNSYSAMVFSAYNSTPRQLRVRSSSSISKSSQIVVLTEAMLLLRSTSQVSIFFSTMNRNCMVLLSSSLCPADSTTWMIEFASIPESSRVSSELSSNFLPRWYSMKLPRTPLS